ncbi:MAG: NUDIX hydrolase [Deltaproteobacteria bacterium]|nr:NUDIX hydrolase [Deltaproteobacteria bacterium]
MTRPPRHDGGHGPLLPFVEVEQGPLERRRIYALRQDRVRSQRTGTELRVDRLFVPDWVNVVAFDEDDHLLLVRQWRFGTNEFTVEIPAGGLEPGENPVEGGLRELVEETGHTPVDRGSVVVLGATRPNAAFMNNRCTTVFVPRARRTAPLSLDPAEEVEVLRVPRMAIDDLLRRGAARCASPHGQPGGAPDPRTMGTPDTDGLLDNSLVVVALHLWRLHEGR